MIARAPPARTCGHSRRAHKNYGGVYRHTMGGVDGGHAVLVIGYSDTEQCWICRNSWGTNWGGAARADGTGAGFFKIGYGECNIDNEPFYGCHGVIPR
jgi:C1A family cysteine protease